MTADNFKIKYDSMEQLYAKTSKKFNEWNTQLAIWSKSYNQTISMESFQGASAAKAKVYLSEVHGSLIIALEDTFKSYQQSMLLYMNGYYGIDSNVHASLPENKMDDLSKRLSSEAGLLDGISRSVGSSLNSVSDIVNIPNPSKKVLESNMDGLKRDIDSFSKKISNYENNQFNEAKASLVPLIDSLDKMVKGYYSSGTGIANYTKGSIKSNPWAVEFNKNFHKETLYMQQNSEEIRLAENKEVEVLKQIANESKESNSNISGFGEAVEDQVRGAVLGFDPKKYLLLDGLFKGGFIFSKDKKTGEIFLKLSKHTFSSNAVFMDVRNDLTTYLGGTSKWSKDIVDDLANDDGLLLFNNNTKKIFKSNFNKIRNSSFKELSDSVKTIGEDLNKGTFEKMASAGSKAFKEDLNIKNKLGNFKGWKLCTGVGRFTKGLGIAGTVMTVAANLKDFKDSDGNYNFTGEHVKNYVVDTGVDVLSGAGASAAGAAAGSFLLPPLGTVVGLGVGTLIGAGFNAKIFNGKSLVEHAKSGMKSLVEHSRKQGYR